jgi:hypothetical protein
MEAAGGGKANGVFGRRRTLDSTVLRNGKRFLASWVSRGSV